MTAIGRGTVAGMTGAQEANAIANGEGVGAGIAIGEIISNYLATDSGEG